MTEENCEHVIGEEPKLYKNEVKITFDDKTMQSDKNREVILKSDEMSMEQLAKLALQVINDGKQ